MSAAHFKVISVAIIAVAANLGTMSETFAANATEYSNGICSFETRGTGKPFKHAGKIRQPNSASTVVTCPVVVPVKTTAFREHLSTRVSVVVKYHQSEADSPLECLVRWSPADNGETKTTESTAQISSRHRGHSEFFFSERIPRGSSMVLWCQLPQGTRLRGYRVW